MADEVYTDRTVVDRVLDRATSTVINESGGADDAEKVERSAATTKNTKMTQERVARGLATLQRYLSAKAVHDSRVVENEEWWRLRSWRVSGRHGHTGNVNPGDPEPSSAYTVNAVFFKHADAMDNYPAPVIRPREQSDEAAAKTLSSIIPIVLERNGYRETYSETWWQKLKFGTGITGVFWDTNKENGLGDISLKSVDVLNMAWEPGIRDIQDSKNLFYIEPLDIETAKELFPEHKDDISGNLAFTPRKYFNEYDEDNLAKTMLIDWYYRIYVNGKPVLHYCKLVGNVVLYCSEDDPVYAERGFYDHGWYPFVFDGLYPIEGAPVGSGIIDLCKPVQKYIDLIDSGLIKSSVFGSKPRYFKRKDCLVDIKQFTDPRNDLVEFTGNGNPNEMLQQIVVNPPANLYANIREMKVGELKEVVGNRDFQQGQTNSGVTAASAITALQEAGNKLSRDMIDASRRAYVRIVLMVIELIRQFYTEERTFRITNDTGVTQYTEFGAAEIAPQQVMIGNNILEKKPIFDIEVASEKDSPYSSIAENERAVQMFQMGMFDPARADQAVAAVELMDFKNKDQTLERIRRGRTMFDMLQSVQQLIPVIMQMAQSIDAIQGTDITNMLASSFQSAGFQVQMPEDPSLNMESRQQINSQNGVQRPTAPSDTPRSAAMEADNRFKTVRPIQGV